MLFGVEPLLLVVAPVELLEPVLPDAVLSVLGVVPLVVSLVVPVSVPVVFSWSTADAFSLAVSSLVSFSFARFLLSAV